MDFNNYLNRNSPGMEFDDNFTWTEDSFTNTEDGTTLDDPALRDGGVDVVAYRGFPLGLSQ